MTAAFIVLAISMALLNYGAHLIGKLILKRVVQRGVELSKWPERLGIIEDEQKVKGVGQSVRREVVFDDREYTVTINGKKMNISIETRGNRT